MYGKHCLNHWSKTQSTLSFSAAESELHGIANGIQVALGMETMCTDLNMIKPLRIHSVAMAAVGIAKRSGLAKLRHLDVEVFWVQENMGDKQVESCKVRGTDYPADLSTTYVDATILNKALKEMGLRSGAGQPKTSSSIVTDEKQ